MREPSHPRWEKNTKKFSRFFFVFVSFPHPHLLYQQRFLCKFAHSIWTLNLKFNDETLDGWMCMRKQNSITHRLILNECKSPARQSRSTVCMLPLSIYHLCIYIFWGWCSESDFLLFALTGTSWHGENWQLKKIVPLSPQTFSTFNIAWNKKIVYVVSTERKNEFF